MDNRTKFILRRLLHDRTFIAIAVIAVLGVSCLIGGLWWETSHRKADQKIAQQNTYEIRLYICTQIENLKRSERERLQASIRSSKKFLKENPQGEGAITADLIREGIDRNEDEVATLAPLKVGCKQFAETGNINP